MNGVIFADVQKCIACRSCELQCAVEHSKSKNICKAVYEWPLPEGRVKVEAAADLSMPLQCRQCEDAPCVTVCPTKAVHRDHIEQPVLINGDLCIGCKMCILVCPFGVIGMDKAGKAVIKCDMCFERLKDGKLPACVMACPTKALQFKTLGEITADKRKNYLVKFREGQKDSAL